MNGQRVVGGWVDEVAATGPGHENDCPECRQGKHGNCTGWALDPDTDAVVECECRAGGHA